MSHGSSCHQPLRMQCQHISTFCHVGGSCFVCWNVSKIDWFFENSLRIVETCRNRGCLKSQMYDLRPRCCLSVSSLRPTVKQCVPAKIQFDCWRDVSWWQLMLSWNPIEAKDSFFHWPDDGLVWDRWVAVLPFPTGWFRSLADSAEQGGTLSTQQTPYDHLRPTKCKNWWRES